MADKTNDSGDNDDDGGGGGGDDSDMEIEQLESLVQPTGTPKRPATPDKKSTMVTGDRDDDDNDDDQSFQTADEGDIDVGDFDEMQDEKRRKLSEGERKRGHIPDAGHQGAIVTAAIADPDVDQS